jgi:hypothetical protein
MRAIHTPTAVMYNNSNNFIILTENVLFLRSHLMASPLLHAVIIYNTSGIKTTVTMANISGFLLEITWEK